ncbi:PTS sugar transporter subunit IIC [Erysipelothrix urinaevulpis]|uniref:PTS sugar transporter subunit IIC n=1 Tax=Erysipelothrix urinaevulpis TaxID=2683717 RepID=UPI00135A7753|nr:PTS transporter subunit EIIC [Erysipelothrix urinaevulpis]
MSKELSSKKSGFTERVMVFVEEKVAPPLIKISNIRYLQTLQRAFMVLMPYMVIGATATLVLNLPGLFAEGTGLNMPKVAEFLTNVLTPLKPGLFQMVFITLNVITLAMVILNGYFLGEHYSREDHQVNAIAAGIVAFTGFIAFIDFGALSENFDWPTYIMGSPSIFFGILISIVSVEIYRILINKKITIKMPDSVPPMVATAFVSMIPVTIVVIIMSFLGQGIPGFDLMAIINNFSEKLVVGGSGPVAQFVGFFLDRILWFVGLHGSNIVGSVMTPVWTTMITENINAFNAGTAIPYMFTNQWINFYVRISLFPIALLALRSNVERFRVLGKLSIVGTIFNIAEPIMFGLPIVLNPIMFVPWVLGFSLTFIFNAILGLLSITPPMVAMVVWTMPAPLAAFIGSGFKFIAPVISLLNYVLIFFIFLPFFRVMEKQELEKEKEFAMASEEEPSLS